MVSSQLRSRETLLPLAIVVLGLVFDRATKIIAEQYLTFREAQSVFGDVFRLVLWYNEGAAFGLRFGSPWVHVTLSLVALVVVAFVLWQTPRSDMMTRVSLALIISGALGNLWDRISVGKVTDFIDIGIGSTRWPTFNVADALVVVGIGLLVLAHLILGRSPRDEEDAENLAEPERAAARSDAE